jgi:hypothetical protein
LAIFANGDFRQFIRQFIGIKFVLFGGEEVLA